MGVLPGKGASVKVGAGPSVVTLLQEWSGDLGVGTEDVTAFGDDWEKTAVTLRNASFSLTGKLDMSDTNGQLALWNSMGTAAGIPVRLYVDSTKYFAGTAHVTKFAPKANVKGINEFSLDGKFDGAVTWN